VRYAFTVIARVVTKRDDARLATFVTASASLFLLLALADDALHLAMFGSPSSAMFSIIAVAIAVAGVGPWLAWSRRGGRAVQVRCAKGVLVAGRLRIAERDVRAISVAHGARGSSVAIKHGVRVAFLEVERAEDAARIAETLGGSEDRTRVVVLPRSRAVAFVQMVVSFTALLAAPLYYLGATHEAVAVSIIPEPKALFGVSGVVAAALSFVFLVMRQLWPNQAMALGARSTWEVHAALHRDRAVKARAEEEAEGEKAADAPAAPVEHVRVGSLGRGNEEVGAWLARIDALPTEQHAYRGAALERDVLWEALGDAAAAVDTRMAAARVLRRRYGEDEGALVRVVVAEPEVRLRIEAALDEHDLAERRIERLGPLFRAR
jgi:hypothetical protein